jgi:large subunit ribosomal protein L30
LIGRPENQRQTVKTLGLGKLHSTVVREDNVATRGLINTVSHLIEVKEV